MTSVSVRSAAAHGTPVHQLDTSFRDFGPRSQPTRHALTAVFVGVRSPDSEEWGPKVDFTARIAYNRDKATDSTVLETGTLSGSRSSSTGVPDPSLSNGQLREGANQVLAALRELNAAVPSTVAAPHDELGLVDALGANERFVQVLRRGQVTSSIIPADLKTPELDAALARMLGTSDT